MGTKRRGLRLLTTEARNNLGHDIAKFTPKLLESVRQDLISKRIPLNKVLISDDGTPGLKAMVRDTGLITFQAHYIVKTQRANVTIGHYPDGNDVKAGQKAIDDARDLTETIRALAAKGVDVQEGLHTRLLRELREKGEKWRP